MDLLTLEQAYSLAHKALDIYAITKDPLTASAIEICFKITDLALTEPQQAAMDLLTKQLDAYLVLFPYPLSDG